ncbi:HORMA domain protein [Atractiella rhizophila]|nr:HORMA domain protein [Atractiella rhizophila]
MATLQKAPSQALALKGSTKTVTEFFSYAVQSILYQRNVLPPENFRQVKKYNLPMLVVQDEVMERYVANIVKQVNAWLLAGEVDRLVLAIITKDTHETVERWQFDVTLENKEAVETDLKSTKPAKVPMKEESEIKSEIQRVIKQITASSTFLPDLQEECTFNILVYCAKDAKVPQGWKNDTAHLLDGNTEQVKLRSWSTNIHKVDSLVSYRVGEPV